MKKLTIEDAKQIELEILDYIDTLCKKHNINYIINYGTLIGAVRHEGFIPWDDDIDLSMPREDYQRFINIFQKEKSKYKLLSLETDKNYFNNFIKIIDSTTKIIDTRNTKTYESGVFIDIFPMDRFDDPKVIDICYKLESFKLLSFSKHKNIVYKDSILKDWIRTAFWLLLRPVSPRYFANKIEKEIQKYSRENGQYMAFIPSKLKEKEVFPSAIIARKWPSPKLLSSIKIEQKLIEKTSMTDIAHQLSISTSTVIRKLNDFHFNHDFSRLPEIMSWDEYAFTKGNMSFIA